MRAKYAFAERACSMPDKILDFYNPLAAHYHLMFEDWNKSIARQAAILNSLVASLHPGGPLTILDCACGIGTQAIGFASKGHCVSAYDLSPDAVARAKHEAEDRGLQISFDVFDMRSLPGIGNGNFDVVAALDNALPHLSPEDVQRAVSEMAAKLKPGGLFLASIRDYDSLIVQRPAMQKPAFYGSNGQRRIVHQVWDWIDGERYVLHLFLTVETGAAWISHHFVSEYRCVLRSELTHAAEAAGLSEIAWRMPPESGFYQPIVTARKP